jgi:hypothetical protein
MQETAYTPYAEIAKQTFFNSILDHEGFLEKYEHILRGEEIVLKRSEDGLRVREVWQKKDTQTLPNEMVDEIINFLKPITESKITAVTDLEEEHIEKISLQQFQAFNQVLCESFLVYGGKEDIDNLNEARMKAVHANVNQIIMSQLRRSFKGTTLTQAASNINVNENRSVPIEQENTGAFKLPQFNIFKKKNNLQFDV